MTSRFSQEIDAARTRWDAAVALLRCWQAHHAAGVKPQWRRDRAAAEFWAAADETSARFDRFRDEPDLVDDDREFLIDCAGGGGDPLRVDAVAHGLSLACRRTFSESWRTGLETDGRMEDGRVSLRAGDVYPVADAPWPQLDGMRRSPAPWKLGYADSEHPFVRAYELSDLTVTFEFTHARPLRAILQDLDVCAALLPNGDLGELGLGEFRPVAFPVAVDDAVDQAGRVSGLLARAMDAGSQLICMPELAWTDKPLAAELVQQQLDADDSCERLLICGSFHTADDAGRPRNVSEGLLSGRPQRMTHAKIAEFSEPFPEDPTQRMFEGVVPSCDLTVHVAGDWRVALLICRDLLEQRVVDELGRVGANVLLVPAMSSQTKPFADRAGQMSAQAQAVTFMVNGPVSWHGRQPKPTVLLTRPYDVRDRLAVTASASPSGKLLSFRDATIRNLP